MITFIKKHILDIVLLILILVPSAYLRFKDIGYSDYIGDEQKSFIRLSQGENLYSFFMKQRKGPMQFVTSYIPYVFAGSYRNEALIRTPYALLSLASIFIFYLLVYKLTKSRTAAFFSSALFASNGFFVGFGRIAQYQNINLVFSFLAIYFAYDVINKKDHLIRSSLLTVLFFTISLMAHWDAVYIVPVLAVYYIKFLKRLDIEKKLKIVVIRNSVILGAVLILPYMIPYVINLRASESNQDYFGRRVATGFTDVNYFKFLIDLYNPYITFYFVSFFALIGALRFKKSWVYTIWFVVTFLIFWYFFRKPGTHIYNFVLPSLVLAGLGIDFLVKLFPKWLKVFPIIIIVPYICFFYYQSYVFFVDHTKEYPWEQKSLYNYPLKYKPNNTGVSKYVYDFLAKKTPVYTMDQKLPLFGFPHNRYWNEINAFIEEQNLINNEKFGYHTNEDKSVSEWYMSTKYTDKNGFYGVGINRPTNFVLDWSYVSYGKSRKVVKEFGEHEVEVKIYRIEPKTPSLTR